MQDGRKAVWSIPYMSVAFFPSLKHNFIAYRSSKVSPRPDCIFEIHQLWQSGFSRVYSNCCCSCSFEPEIIKIGLSSHKMYSNNIVNFPESTLILDSCTKKSLETYWWHHVLSLSTNCWVDHATDILSSDSLSSQICWLLEVHLCHDFQSSERYWNCSFHLTGFILLSLSRHSPMTFSFWGSPHFLLSLRTRPPPLYPPSHVRFSFYLRQNLIFFSSRHSFSLFSLFSLTDLFLFFFL